MIQCIARKNWRNSTANFRSVCMVDIAAVEKFLQTDIFLCDIDLADGSLIAELPRRSVRKHSNTVQLLRFISHICHLSDINALFKAYRCPSCDHFNKMAYDLERQLTSCKKMLDTFF